MKILAETDDTSLISRCGYEKACAYRKKAGELAAEELERKDYGRILRDLDREMTEDHASPGGSADLLAMTYFLYFMETGRVPSTVK
jgi:holo-ACP synthase/triphosphoribosyl-dephospho-CoA synthase